MMLSPFMLMMMDFQEFRLEVFNMVILIRELMVYASIRFNQAKGRVGNYQYIQ